MIRSVKYIITLTSPPSHRATGRLLIMPVLYVGLLPAVPCVACLAFPLKSFHVPMGSLLDRARLSALSHNWRPTMSVGTNGGGALAPAGDRNVLPSPTRMLEVIIAVVFIRALVIDFNYSQNGVGRVPNAIQGRNGFDAD